MHSPVQILETRNMLSSEQSYLVTEVKSMELGPKMTLNFDLDEDSNDSGIYDEDSGISSEESFNLEDDEDQFTMEQFCCSLENRRKRPAPKYDADTEGLSPSKRQRLFEEIYPNDISHDIETDQDMIGDRTRSYCLPTVAGKHKDLKSISAETMQDLLTKEQPDSVDITIVDCRYPYEYNGGHIKGAVNIWQRNELVEQFFRSSNQHKQQIIIFHCEFSSERGPRMARYLRELDREMNTDCYPSLYYPELYVLDGGYKALYQQTTELCEPQSYTPMDHPSYRKELKCSRRVSRTGRRQRSRLPHVDGDIGLF